MCSLNKKLNEFEMNENLKQQSQKTSKKQEKIMSE
jgi:hypothetical protein